MFLQVIKGIVSLFLFHLDFIKDVMMLNVIRYTNNTLLNDEDLKTRFDSVGGMNLQVLIAYLSAVLVVGEVMIYIHIYNQSGMMKSMYNGRFDSWVLDGMLAIFPVQYVILKKTAIQMNIMRLEHHIDLVLHSNKVILPACITKEVIEASEEKEQLQHQLYKINNIQCEMGILQSSFEREPQTIVQICLLILMTKFRRIKLLFSAYIGIPVKLVVGASSLMSMHFIANSIYKYHNCKNWKSTPDFLGAVTQHLAVFSLVSSKLIFVAIILLNAYYLHTFVFISNLVFIHFYIKFTDMDGKNNIFLLLKTGLAPAFYKPSRTISSKPLMKYFLGLSQKYPMVNTVTLQFATLFLYCYVGGILRSTMFHFNINNDYQSHIEDDEMPQYFANSTEALGMNDRDSERKKKILGIVDN